MSKYTIINHHILDKELPVEVKSGFYKYTDRYGKTMRFLVFDRFIYELESSRWSKYDWYIWDRYSGHLYYDSQRPEIVIQAITNYKKASTKLGELL